MKSPHLRHHQARSQNKGLYRARWLQTTPLWWQAARAGRGQLSTKLQAGFFADEDFLGFWTVNAHLRRCTGCTPRKPSSRNGEAINRGDCAHQPPHHLSCSDLGRTQNAGPTNSVPLRTSWVPEPEWLSTWEVGSLGPASDGSRWSNIEPEQCGQEGHRRREQGQAQCGWDTVSTCQCYLFAASLPLHSATEQVSLKKCPPSPSLCQGRNQTLKRPANRRSQNRGNCLGSDRCNKLKPCC